MKVSRTIKVTTASEAIDLLTLALPDLSKGRLKDAMNKGALSVQKGKQHRRMRRAQAIVQPGEILHLNYDDDLLNRSCAPAELIADEEQYSVWFKPPGMLSQGNEWGDHLALLRHVELHFAQKRQVFLVHRLDREASGLVVIAHSKTAAAALSLLMQNQQMHKTYHVQVRGQFSAALKARGQVDLPIDGKPSCSQFHILTESTEPSRTWLEVTLITGRKHQIRRHFAAVGHPVMGDPQYGNHNQDPAGLGLQAVTLAFSLPGKPKRQYQLPEHLRRFMPVE
ncbi:MAG: RluA family pseudouridine synthase [Gammaproteobacteria bacterium]|nr:RluA family pseudouridine synthase [Gammaproteobacteria bacterium]